MSELSGPLKGVRVIEMGQLLAGPFAGSRVADFGAEVIKVEPPGTHGKFVLIFVAGLRHSMMGHQLSLASLQGLGAGFGRYRAAL